jgi:hypothetical protein
MILLSAYTATMATSLCLLSVWQVEALHMTYYRGAMWSQNFIDSKKERM